MRARVIATLMFAGVLTSCPPIELPDHAYPAGALYLDPSSGSRLDRLNCVLKDCERWFSTRLSSRGDLSVAVDGSTLALALGYSVRLTDERGAHLIASQANAGDMRVQIQRDLAPGTYLIGVLSDPDAQAFKFRLRLAFDPAPLAPEPAPAPRFETHTSAVLETVGYGQDSVAVLIESGARLGMQVGFRGVLIDDGEEIGSVVIEQVYPDGSRARIEGALASPVTHTTVARIRVPAGLGIGDETGGEGSEELPFEFPPTDEDGGQEP